MIGRAVYQHMLATPAIVASVVDRIYPKLVPEGEDVVYPLAVYVVEDEDRQGTYGGGSGLVSCKVTIACLARKPSELKTLRDAVMDAFDEADGEWAGVTVQGCFFEDENELADRDPTTGEESLYFGSELTFLVWYETGE